MKRVGVFMDVSNLYYCIGKKFQGAKLNYKTYLEFVARLGEIHYAIAYGAQLKNEAAGFIHYLKQSGFETKYKEPRTYTNDSKIRRKADWDVGIAIDIVNAIERLDIIILGTADGDLVPVVEWARARGVSVVVVACRISRDLRNAANTCIEIPTSLLEEKDSEAIKDATGS